MLKPNLLHAITLCLMRLMHSVLHVVKWKWTAFKWQWIMFSSRNFAKRHRDSGFKHIWLDFWSSGTALLLPFTLAYSSMSKSAHCVLMALAAFLKQSGLRVYVCKASDDIHDDWDRCCISVAMTYMTYQDWYARNRILGYWADRLNVKSADERRRTDLIHQYYLDLQVC